MAWYAYCLTEHQTLPNGTRTRRPFLLEGVQGVNGAAVLSYPSGEFAVIVSEFDHTAGELGQKTAIEHARVVSSCFRNSTVLPFRFGTVFESDDALRQDREPERILAVAMPARQSVAIRHRRK